MENNQVNIFLNSVTAVAVTCNNCNPVPKCSDFLGEPNCSDTRPDPAGLPRIGTSATTSVVNKVLTIEARMSVNTGGVTRARGPFRFVFSCGGVS